jgi:phasin family protein
MADTPKIEADTSAEKAYAAAAEAVNAKPEPIAAPAEVEFPSKARRSPGPKAAKPKAAAVAKPSAAKKAVKTMPKLAARAMPAAKPVTRIKPVKTGKTMFQQLKDKTMDTAEFTTKMKSAVAEVQVKAKEAFDKGAAAFNDYNEFSKGNLEAVVESGKILASGVQSLGTTAVEDTKTAFETLTEEVKELASVKSPADFFKLQAAFVRRNFDLAVAQTSKNSEAVLKLANEVAAPISGRVSLAVEKIKQAA